MGLVLRRLLDHLRRLLDPHVNCVVIAPVWARPWNSLLAMLPVTSTYNLPHIKGAFQPGPRLGKHSAIRQLRGAVKAYTITWNK